MGRGGLLRGEEALLLPGNLEKPSRRIAVDVTGDVKVTQTPPRLNSSTGDYNSKIAIQNNSGAAIAAPVSAVFDG